MQTKAAPIDMQGLEIFKDQHLGWAIDAQRRIIKIEGPAAQALDRIQQFPNQPIEKDDHISIHKWLEDHRLYNGHATIIGPDGFPIGNATLPPSPSALNTLLEDLNHEVNLRQLKLIKFNNLRMQALTGNPDAKLACSELLGQIWANRQG